MNIDKAFAILGSIENAEIEEAIKKVESDLDFYKRSFEGVQQQVMKQFAEIENLKAELLKKNNPPEMQELYRINTKLRNRNHTLEDWYADHMEELEDILDAMHTDFDYMKEKLQEVEDDN